MTRAGCVLAGVLKEIGMIPVDAQDPALVAQALAFAYLVDDPESVAVAPQAAGRMRDVLAELHEKAGDDD